ncbi:MAG: hypothetical protein K1X89_08320 [Myxococcaceae bacterium]|nr:hypothetical protein [Myxococcaceae bacterium]
MRTVSICLMLCASLASAEAPKLVVLDLSPGGGLDPTVAAALTDAVAAAAARGGQFSVTSSKEIQTLLGVERQKQLSGCSDGGACLAEIGSALGARFILSGSATLIGQSYQLSLQMQDSDKAQTIGRATRLAGDLDGLRALVPYAVAEATGTPAPQEPSRVLPLSLTAGGVVSATVGVFLLVQTASQVSVYQRELELGLTSPQVLKSLDFYQDEQRRLTTQRVVSFVLLGAGAALAATGLFLYPWRAGGLSGTAALVPTGQGAAFAGTF